MDASYKMEPFSLAHSSFLSTSLTGRSPDMTEILLTWTLSLNSINQGGTCETIVAAAYSACPFIHLSHFSTIFINETFSGVTVVIIFASMKIKSTVHHLLN